MDNINIENNESKQKLNIKKIVIDKEYYKNIDNIIKESIKNVTDDIDEIDLDLGNVDRVKPAYKTGTFNENGIPNGEKQRLLWETIVGAKSWIVVAEGGVRGGKDVIGLSAWADYLMNCPEKRHIALGITLEHALHTILISNNFGIYNCIPHGRFLRKSINGAQRGVFEFEDNYGVTKEVLFYGNAKKDDYEKYHGFTIGSFYINEGINQHLNGINEAIQRTSSAKDKLIIITQNPKGTANQFYTKFESTRLGSNEEISKILEVKNNKEVCEAFRYAEKEINNKLRQELKRKKQEFATKKGYPTQNLTRYLSEKERVEYAIMRKNIGTLYKKTIKDLQIGQFATWIPKKINGQENMFYKISMIKCVDFIEYVKNPNNVKNYIDYYYFHFTIEDNPAMSDTDRAELYRQYPPNSAIFDQMVKGIRRSSENSMFPDFNYEINTFGVFGEDVSVYDNFNNRRVIALDAGYSHPTGMLDSDIDYSDGTTYIFTEMLLTKNEVKEPTDVERYYWELVRGRRKREQCEVLGDPSATATNNYLRSRGISVKNADNRKYMAESEIQKYGNKTLNKELIGVELLRTAMKLGKLKIHVNCVNLISQIESAEWKHDDERDKDERNKINDDLTDPLRYIVNTYIRVAYWEITEEMLKGEIDNGEPKNENDTTAISHDEKKKRQKEEIYRIFYGKQQDKRTTNIFGQQIGNDRYSRFNNGNSKYPFK